MGTVALARIDARISLREIVAQARRERLEFVVLEHVGHFFALRADELAPFADSDQPAFRILGLAPSNASQRSDAIQRSAPVQTRGPATPWRQRTVHVDGRGRPLRVEEPSAKPAEDLLAGSYREHTRPLSASGPGGSYPAMSPAMSSGPSMGTPRSVEPGAPREDTSIVRYPSIDAVEPADPSAEVVIVIDLVRDPELATRGDPIRFDDLADDWRRLPVQVHVVSPQLAFAHGDDLGTVLVRRDGSSVRCRLVGRRVRPGPLTVTATFFHHDRWCGTAQRTFDAREAPAAAAVAIAAGAQAPDLTVHIHRTEADRRKLVWILAPAAAHRAHVGRACAETLLAEDPEPYVRGLFRAAATSRPGDHVALLHGIGERLWELAPPAFHDAYWSLRGALGDGFTIQLITDEPHIPWELMRPLRAGASTRLLAETHPVARGLLAYPDRLRPRLPSDGDILTVAPDYTRRAQPGLPPLETAAAESAMLQARYGATAIAPASVRQITHVLADGRGAAVRILHFAGHAQTADPVEQSHVACEDGDVAIAHVRRQETMLGERYRTFVLFNACGAGAAGDALGSVGGWAEAFAYRNFGGFVAPLWAVSDAYARVAMERFFDDVLAHRKPVGEALRDVRASYGRYAPTFLSYVYYGDVNARFA
ncbi:MAG TPA: CHAT domain-containing protein [Kofleriaceae bacterium]|nr:CHAT domain-containing protein [Kofleriaceae bacterium]